MLGDGAKKALTKGVPDTKSVRATLCFGEEKNKFGFISTNGLYYVSKKTSIDKKSLKFQYLIRADVFAGNKLRTSCWKGLPKASPPQQDAINFLLEFTNISEELFNIAADNPGTPIPFCLDMVKYYEYYKKNHPGESTEKILWEEYEK